MWDQLLAKEKFYRDQHQLISARGDFYEKILEAPFVGVKHRYKCNISGKKNESADPGTL